MVTSQLKTHQVSHLTGQQDLSRDSRAFFGSRDIENASVNEKSPSGLLQYLKRFRSSKPERRLTATKRPEVAYSPI